MSVSPLRQHGRYRFAGREFTAVHLFDDDGEPWRSTALIDKLSVDGIFYVRHDDGVLIAAANFKPVGSISDLEDTGRDDDDDASPWTA